MGFFFIEIFSSNILLTKYWLYVTISLEKYLLRARFLRELNVGSIGAGVNIDLENGKVDVMYPSLGITPKFGIDINR